ncbi:MAG TPA: sulfotransferase [Rhizomicrobium sp.]
MDKVFGIGFQKTGTSSLAAALEILGYRTNHGVFINHPEKRRSLHIAPPLTTEKVAAQALPLIAEYDALTDNPWPLLYRELDAAYPGSKFVLTVRDPQNWIASLVQHFDDRESDVLEWIYGCRSVRGNEARCLEVYASHNAAVRAYFANRPAALLELSFDSPRSWNALCDFLGKPTPAKPFPHANTAAERARKQSGFWRKLKNAVRAGT